MGCDGPLGVSVSLSLSRLLPTRAPVSSNGGGQRDSRLIIRGLGLTPRFGSVLPCACSCSLGLNPLYYYSNRHASHRERYVSKIGDHDRAFHTFQFLASSLVLSLHVRMLLHLSCRTSRCDPCVVLHTTVHTLSAHGIVQGGSPNLGQVQVAAAQPRTRASTYARMHKLSC